MPSHIPAAILLCVALLVIASHARADGSGPLLTLKEDVPTGLAFSPDGRLLAVGSAKGDVRLLTVPDGRLSHTLAGHSAQVSGVAFRQDGKALATGGFDGAIKLWDPATGKPLAAWDADAEWRVVQFSPDGQRLITWASIGPLTAWDVSTRKPLFSVRNVTRMFAARPDAKEFATFDLDNGVQFWDGATGRELPKRENYRNAGRMCYSPAGDHIAFAEPDGFVRIKQAATGKDLVKMATGAKDVRKLTFRADGKQLACCTLGAPAGDAIVWDAATGGEVYRVRVEGDNPSVLDLAFSPDGKHLATASGDMTVRLWDLTKPPPALPVTPPNQPGVAVPPPPPVVPPMAPPVVPADPPAPARPPEIAKPPAEPPRAKPAAATAMQAIAGKWALNKTVTVTLEADGSVKTGFGQMRNGTWTIAADQTVTIRSSKGATMYSFKVDDTGKAGTGKWKDGSGASPKKLQ